MEDGGNDEVTSLHNGLLFRLKSEGEKFFASLLYRVDWRKHVILVSRFKSVKEMWFYAAGVTLNSRGTASTGRTTNMSASLKGSNINPTLSRSMVNLVS